MRRMSAPILPQSEYHRDAGLRLRRLIAALGITQVEAARLMGVSKHVLRNWLAGDNPIQPYALYRLCQARRVDFNFVHLGDWSRLPADVAQVVEDEVLSTLEVCEAAASPEAARASQKRQKSTA
jgi:transcriptional regulator with XRE-family HTH domain